MTEGESRERADPPPADDYARLDGKVASLSAALLARKGAAAPSLKRFANRPENPFAEGRPCGKSPEGACPVVVSARRASLSLRMPVPEFLRLKLASGLFERTSQSILLEALTHYLDARGVERFEDCLCLQKAARLGPNSPGGGSQAGE
jgi:hypothetical protein